MLICKKEIAILDSTASVPFYRPERGTAQSALHESVASLLLVTHVAIRQGPYGCQIDDQTAAGVQQWCRRFEKVAYYGIDLGVQARSNSTVWVDAGDIEAPDRLQIISLPRAYRTAAMLRAFSRVRAILRSAITEHHYLCFTIGGLVGDWPSLAALESIHQERPYSAWIDRVEPSIIRNRVATGPVKSKMLAAAAIPLMERYTRHLLKNSSVALLQGLDTFDHYARWAPRPHCIYDTHTKQSDEISPKEISTKQTRILSGAPLRIIYVGRVDAMKGPSDWLDVLECVQNRRISFQAIWIGDGPELEKMKDRVTNSTLACHVSFPGFEGDRGELLRLLRSSDMLLFCHKTIESPRCLIESLVSGCPLVGYESAYSRGLVQDVGGAALVMKGNVAALAEQVELLDNNRPVLARLVAMAAECGKAYNEDAVYSHRASLIQLAF